MPTEVFDTVIVRFGGEIGIKAPSTRRQYEHRLTRNIKAALKHHAVPYSTFIKKAGRLYIKTHTAENAAQKLSRVFGISSLSPATETSSQLEDILKTSIRLADSTFKPRKTFAVKCHRVGKHPYTSQDICVKVGNHILTKLPKLELRVDLTEPQQTLQVEVREDKAYIFTDIIKCAGGLPLGTQPKLVCMLKGDTQSTTSCWMTMKRGCPTVLVHVQNMSSAEPTIKKATAQAHELMEWNIGFPAKLRVIRCPTTVQKIAEIRPFELASLLQKRLILKIAKRIAETTDAEGIVTGDSLGSNASQTLRAYGLQDEAVKEYPVYRPLLGMNPAEIKATATKIGLHETSHEPKSKTETTPKTHPVKLRNIKQAENRLKIKDLVDSALTSLTVQEL